MTFPSSLRLLPGLLLVLAAGCSHPIPAPKPAAPAAPVVAGAFEDDAHALTPIESSVVAAGQDPAKLAALARELLATMQKPDTPAALAQEAAQHLGYVLQAGAQGPDAATLAALAPLLANPARADNARLALDRVPGETVDALYLAALPAASGRTRAGLIESLGTRRAATAVAALAPGLRDPDAAIVTATAQALGRIGGAAALAALESAPDPLAPAVLNARLAAARETAEAPRVTAAIYGNPAAPLPQRAAALRQLIDASPADAVNAIHSALVGHEPAFQAVAIHAVGTLPVSGAAAALAGRLGAYSPDVQVALIAALGGKGDAGAVPGLLQALAGTDATVRLAALEALGRLPGTPEVALKLAAVAAAKGDEAKIASASLARLDGPGLDEFIRTSAASGDAALQPVFIQQIAARNLTEAIPFLLSLRTSPAESLRLEALDALRAIAPPADQQAVIDWALGNTTKAEQTRAVRALVTILLRDDNVSTRATAILSALNTGQAPARIVLLPALSRVAGPAALATAGSLALDGNEGVATTAVTELSRWPDATALPLLVDAAVRTRTEEVRTIAVQGATRFLGQSAGVTSAQRSQQTRALLALPLGVTARVALIKVLSLCGDRPALATAQRFLADLATAAEARDAVDAITSNLAGAPVFTASASPAETALLTDGKLNTHWTAPNGPGTWLRADFHNSRPIHKLILDQGTREWEFPAHVEVQVSDDPEKPGEALLKVEGTRYKTLVNLPAGVRGRYVWLRLTDPKNGSWVIGEFGVE